MALNRKKRTSGRKRFSIEMSGGELFGWTGLLLVVCLWFFVLGLLVGRGWVPVPGVGSPLKKELAQARENTLAQKAAEAQVRLDFHEALKTDDPRPPEGPAVLAPATVKPSSPPVPAPTAAPPEAKKAPSSEKPVPADTDSKIFTIQVAAVKDAEAARDLIETLKKKGFDAYITQAELAGGIVWHRIRCGAFENREAASPLLSRLKDAGYGPMLVRR
ncbi:SPOR domain-containing protein [Desulfosudis oleivorans]|uniref:Sporulation domain protein n=1 Tax=Desulfosudis oleivorans (strain DSM 6200 / JCM 39069 / Hxd3) TaxID=96561 RepID=A9A098_DESOH|nr:SPOR domain-containing protein [Desulfosudis oleivorans]ABW69017.1 Sporulation domain protein [Desulfosudis oleivorans Hxd3]